MSSDPWFNSLSNHLLKSKKSCNACEVIIESVRISTFPILFKHHPKPQKTNHHSDCNTISLSRDQSTWRGSYSSSLVATDREAPLKQTNTTNSLAPLPRNQRHIGRYIFHHVGWKNLQRMALDDENNPEDMGISHHPCQYHQCIRNIQYQYFEYIQSNKKTYIAYITCNMSYQLNNKHKHTPFTKTTLDSSTICNCFSKTKSRQESIRWNLAQETSTFGRITVETMGISNKGNNLKMWKFKSFWKDQGTQGKWLTFGFFLFFFRSKSGDDIAHGKARIHFN